MTDTRRRPPRQPLRDRHAADGQRTAGRGRAVPVPLQPAPTARTARSPIEVGAHLLWQDGASAPASPGPGFRFITMLDEQMQQLRALDRRARAVSTPDCAATAGAPAAPRWPPPAEWRRIAPNRLIPPCRSAHAASQRRSPPSTRSTSTTCSAAPRLALQRGGFDHLVVPSGTLHYQVFDDRDYPVRGESAVQGLAAADARARAAGWWSRRARSRS